MRSSHLWTFLTNIMNFLLQINQTLWIREAVNAGFIICSKSRSGGNSEQTQSEFTNPDKDYTKDTFFDRWVRGKKEVGNKMGPWNEHGIRYDETSDRWYLKLSALDVKEIRAKVWQCQTKSVCEYMYKGDIKTIPHSPHDRSKPFMKPLVIPSHLIPPGPEHMIHVIPVHMGIPQPNSSFPLTWIQHPTFEQPIETLSDYIIGSMVVLDQ